MYFHSKSLFQNKRQVSIHLCLLPHLCSQSVNLSWNFPGVAVESESGRFAAGWDQTVTENLCGHGSAAFTSFTLQIRILHQGCTAEVQIQTGVESLCASERKKKKIKRILKSLEMHSILIDNLSQSVSSYLVIPFLRQFWVSLI